MSRPSVLLLGLLGAAVPLWAQTWVPVGPPGGDVRALAADPRDPRIVYLGTADGALYRSEDAGVRWQRAIPGFPRRGVALDEIHVDPRGRVLVAFWEVAGDGGGVARSLDGGRSFTLLDGIAGESVRALGIAPSDPDVVVAGSLGGVFRSGDGGDTWRRISPEGDLELRHVESLAVDPEDPQQIYAGTWHLPWKTSDGGRTWRPAKTGMIEDSDVFTLTLDRRSPSTLYATACSGIYRSHDAAARWSKLRGIPVSSRRTRSFAQDPDAPDTLYAGTTEGLWSSTDAGANWRLLTGNDLVVNAVVPLPGGAVLLGCDGAGVLRSSDGGQTWAAANDGFSERIVSRLVHDRDTQRWLAGIAADRAHGGVFAAPSPLGPWSRLGPGLEGREVLSLQAAPSMVAAGTDDGLFLLGAGGWMRLPTLVRGMDVHPRVEDVALPRPGTILAATQAGLLRSTDAGRSWALIELGLAARVSAVAASPRDPALVLASTPEGVFESRDAGARWTPVSASALGVVYALAFLPGDDQVVFAVTPSGLFKSIDRGRHFYPRGGGLRESDISSLAADQDGRTLYASDYALGGLYRSDDRGETWSPLTLEGLPSARIFTLAADPGAPGRLLAATAAGGLHLFAPAPARAGAGSP